MNLPVAELNRLRNSNSPYLLAHADNPVDWYPWGPDAIERARREDKPILLSIGYAACHWCHVMEHESFRDESIAALMNEHFVCVKVDREERPDVDEVYMTATVALTGHGGWPMTVFLTPDCNAFFAGTYFPPDDRFGRPGFKSVLQSIATAWRTERQRIVEEGGHITEQLRAMVAPNPSQSIAPSLIDVAIVQLRANFDAQFGGFGGAPKFPPHAALRLLADSLLGQGAANSAEMATVTLTHITNGGIHDHLGGGFARYSTDGFWHVPHFEKMLYDNAQLAKAYLVAYRHTAAGRYRTTLERLLHWVMGEMTSPEGGFYTSLDADSEGEEGRYYTFKWDEIQQALDRNEIELAARYFDVRPEGNWEGTNVLWTPTFGPEFAQEMKLTEPELTRRIASIEGKLLELRAARPRPTTDDKILVGHTGLMLGAFALAGRVLGNSRYVDVAERAALFVSQQMTTAGGQLVRVYRRGQRGQPAMLEDYAYLAEGLLDLYEATGRARHLRFAETLANRMMLDFYDIESERLYNSPAPAETLPLRIAESHDGACPNATAVAAIVLRRLSVQLNRPKWHEMALAVLCAHGQAIGRIPRGHCDLLRAARLCQQPVTTLVFIPGTNSVETADLWEVYREILEPSIVLAHLPHQASREDLELPLLTGKAVGDAKPAAYACRGETCSAPVHSAAELRQLLATMR